MRRFIMDTGISLSNRAWKIAGKSGASMPELTVTLPEQGLTDMCASVFDQIVEKVAFPFGNRFRTRWYQASRDPSMSSSTETAFAASLLRHWDPEAAYDILRVFFYNRSIEGRMPLSVTPFTASSYPAYPFVLHALCRWHDSTGDTARARDLFRKYLKFSDWLVIYHKLEGGLYGHRDEHWFHSDFLARPLVDARPDLAARSRDITSVGLNSIMAYQYRLMSRAGFAAGEPREGRKLDNHARKLAVMLHDKFWDDEAGFYLDCVGPEHAKNAVISGLLPLCAEAPARTQAARMAERIDKLVPPIIAGIPARYKDSVFIYLIADGLSKYGMGAQASKMSLDFAKAAASLHDLPENMFQRTIAVNSLLDHVLGYYNYGGRIVINPNLPESWKGKTCSVEDLSRGTKVELALQDENRVNCTINRHKGPPITFTIENGKFKNIDLTGTGQVSSQDVQPSSEKD